MGVLELIFGIILLVFAVATVIIVLSQQGEQKNSGVLTGGSSDTYISRNSGRTIDAFLARWTKFFAVGFFIFVIVVNILVRFVGNVEYAEAIDTDTQSSVSETVSGAEATESAAGAAAGETASSEAAVESTEESAAA